MSQANYNYDFSFLISSPFFVPLSFYRPEDKIVLITFARDESNRVLFVFITNIRNDNKKKRIQKELKSYVSTTHTQQQLIINDAFVLSLASGI